MCLQEVLYGELQGVSDKLSLPHVLFGNEWEFSVGNAVLSRHRLGRSAKYTLNAVNAQNTYVCTSSLPPSIVLPSQYQSVL